MTDTTTNKKPIKQYIIQPITTGLYCNHCRKYVDDCTTKECPYYREENNAPSRLYKNP